MTYSVNEINNFEEQIKISAEYNFMKWSVLGTTSETIYKWEIPKTYLEQVEFLKEWCIERINIINGLF